MDLLPDRPPLEPTPDETHAPAVPPRRRPLREAALIGFVALSLNLAGNGRISLWDRDEPRYAVCTREMRASGDWIHPTFNGAPRYDKPVLIYWLMLLGTNLGGDNPFGARLVSSLAGAGMCLAVWALGRRMLGDRAGWMAGLILATTPLMVAEAKLSTTDATLGLLILGCQACLWELDRRPSRGWALGFWALLALATLTKGPVGPVLIAAAGLISWWWGGPGACWKRLGWRWGLALYLALTLPWFVAIGVMTQGEFFKIAMGYHVVRRMSVGIEQHGGFPGYYVLSTLLTLYPWSALLPAALVGAWARRRNHPELAFLLGWVVGPWLVVEAVQTKLPHYYFPSYPACALLASWLIGAVARDEVNLRRWPMGRLGLGLLGGVGLGTAATLVAAAVILPGPMRWPLLLQAAILIAGTLVAIERFQQAATERAAQVLAATWAAIALIAGAWLLPSAEPYRFPRIVAERLAALSERSGAEPMLSTFQEPSIIYALRRPRPVALFRGRTDLIRRVGRDGALLTALMPQELDLLRIEPDLEFRVAEVLRGFNLNKGKSETLLFTLIRKRAGSAASSRLAGSGRSPAQQALVQ